MEKVNVIISTHDRPEILQETVARFANQTLGDVNFLICDNGLNPQTQEVAADFMSQDRRVAYVNSNHLGVGATINKNYAIDIADVETPYTFLTDDDDFPDSDQYLATMYDLIRRGNDTKGHDDLFAYSPQFVVREKGHIHNCYSKIDEPMAVAASLDSGHPNIPGKGGFYNTRFIKRYPVSPIYKNTGEDYGLVMDTALRLKMMGLVPAYTDDVAAQYFTRRAETRLKVHNRKHNPAYVQSRRIVRRRLLKYLGYDS